MFLHIGESRIVFSKDIVGIFSLDIRDKEVNRQFLEFSPKDGDFKDEATGGENKSFIVTTDRVFFSPISSYALARRKKKS
ncbi:MAG: DUF370 domain-containing protein [Firmicutes bacterium]|jgi:hypothetical protein|nr:DUF370 domain-containing protein [Bacillota bacterium]